MTRHAPVGPLTRGGAAKRFAVDVVDLPELGRRWTARDVAEAQRARLEWLRSARKLLAAVRAEEKRYRLRAGVAAETRCGDGG